MRYRADEGFRRANLPWRNTRGPQYGVDVCGFVGSKSEVGGTMFSSLVENFLEGLTTSVERKTRARRSGRKDALQRPTKNAIGLSVDENRGDLLSVRSFANASRISASVDL